MKRNSRRPFRLLHGCLLYTSVGRLLNDEEAIDKLEIPALNKGRVPQYLKANMLAATAITVRPVFAGCIGPYSFAGRLYDMSEIMMLIYINPEAANSLLKKCSDFILRYCCLLYTSRCV